MNWDPIRFDGGGNLYRYAGNNPVTGTDPSGLNTYSMSVPNLDGVGLGGTVTGPTYETGVYLNTIGNTPIPWEVGTYQETGLGFGKNRGAGANIQVTPGNISNFEGKSAQVNTSYGLLDAGFNITNGAISLGPGLGEQGGDITFTETTTSGYNAVDFAGDVSRAYQYTSQQLSNIFGQGMGRGCI